MPLAQTVAKHQPAGFRVSLPRKIGLVLTGGTIASQQEEDGSWVLAEQPHPALQDLLDQERGRGTQFVVRRPFWKSSEEVIPSDWERLNQACRELGEEGVEGILILHGTETLAYSAAALALGSLDCPVVLTGSKRPAGHPMSDAEQNIKDGLLALSKLPQGAWVVFGGEIHPPLRVRKTPEGEFHTINGEPVGRINNGQVQLQALLPRVNLPSELRFSTEGFDPRVLGIKLYPGIDLAWIRDCLGDKRVLVIEGYPWGSGPVAGNYSLLDLLEDCQKEGILVVLCVTSLSKDGLGSYASFRVLQERGIVWMGEWSWEASLAIAMRCLAAEGGRDTSRLRQMMSGSWESLSSLA